MALAGDRPVRPLTQDDVLAMVDAGILTEDDEVELLRGALVAVSPHSRAHAVAIGRLNVWLARALDPARHELGVQVPFAAADPTSLPEPDLYVVPATGDVRHHPHEAHLVIEVAWRTLRTDTLVKAAIYAESGIPESWVVDLQALEVLVFTEPSATDGTYARRSAHRAPATLRPTKLDVPPLDLTALFAGLG